MINGAEQPVAWALLIDELSDAHEHLGDLIITKAKEGRIDIEAYGMDIAHVYAHLNRAWNSRNTENELTESQWEKFR